MEGLLGTASTIFRYDKIRTIGSLTGHETNAAVIDVDFDHRCPLGAPHSLLCHSGIVGI